MTRLRQHELDRPVLRPVDVDAAAVVTVLRVPPEASGMRVDRFVQTQLRKTSRTRAQLIVQRSAYGEEGTPLRASRRVRAEQLVCLWRPPWDETGDPDMVLPILGEDDALIAVDKPAMIPVHPTARYYRSTVVKILETQRPDERFRLAHRLDRETSGVLLLSKTSAADTHVKRQFQGQDPATGRFDHRRRVEKSYLAIVRGSPPEDVFRVALPLETDPNPLRVKMRIAEPGTGLASATRVEVLGRRERSSDGAAYALVRCHLETGRQHQIRVHLAAVGQPILGDKLYGGFEDDLFRRASDGALTPEDAERLEIARHALHAERMSLEHPDRPGERVQFVAPLAADLQAFWDALES